MMILPVNTSTVLLTCKILQIYFDKLKLTSHNCYDGLLNTAEASSVHCDGRKMTEVLLPQVCMPVTGLGRARGKAPDYRRVLSPPHSPTQD